MAMTMVVQHRSEFVSNNTKQKDHFVHKKNTSKHNTVAMGIV